mmetsp:Transcript_11327/g.35846  ORF Transcript_11327/g.35846 Transcript_11327/m.35846 type:complete len:403 (-) Transcript_11327:613-1821(-)
MTASSMATKARRLLAENCSENLFCFCGRSGRPVSFSRASSLNFISRQASLCSCCSTGERSMKMSHAWMTSSFLKGSVRGIVLASGRPYTTFAPPCACAPPPCCAFEPRHFAPGGAFAPCGPLVVTMLCDLGVGAVASWPSNISYLFMLCTNFCCTTCCTTCSSARPASANAAAGAAAAAAAASATDLPAPPAAPAAISLSTHLSGFSKSCIKVFPQQGTKKARVASSCRARWMAVRSPAAQARPYKSQSLRMDVPAPKSRAVWLPSSGTGPPWSEKVHMKSASAYALAWATEAKRNSLKRNDPPHVNNALEGTRWSSADSSSAITLERPEFLVWRFFARCARARTLTSCMAGPGPPSAWEKGSSKPWMPGIPCRHGSSGPTSRSGAPISEVNHFGRPPRTSE